MIDQRLELLLEVRPGDIGDLLHDFFVAQDVDVGHGNRCRNGVTGICVAVIEVAMRDHHVGHAITHHHAAEWHVTAGDALGKRHQIRLNAERFAAPPVAGAPEAADHFIGDQQHVVFFADALNFRPIGFRWNDHAACALHRLTDERCDFIGTNIENRVLQPRCGLKSEFVRAQFRKMCATNLKPVRLLDMRDVGDRQSALLMHAFHAAERRAGHGAAVIPVPATNDGLLLRLPEATPVVAHEADDGVVAFGT